MRHPFLPLALAVTVAIRASAAPDPIEGRWTGTVSAPQGEVAEIGLHFQRDTRGALALRLHFPAMFTHDAPLGAAVETAGDGRYTLPAFATELRLEGDRLTGTFTAAGLPLDLRRGGEFSPPPPEPVHPQGPAPLWQHDLGAGTWAPPATDGAVVYIGGGDGRFHAVDAADGRARWVWTGSAPIDGRAVVGPAAVYFLDTRGDLVALDRATGALRWRRPLHDAALAGGPAPDNPTFNHRAATPLLDGATLYAGSSDGGLYAVAAADGAVRWRHDARAPVYSGIALDGDGLLFGTMDGSVVRLDRGTRLETLRVKTGGGVVTTPVVAGGRLVAGSRDYLLHAFDPADGAPAWRFSYWFSWIESTPALRDGRLYLGGSDYARVSALDPATGRADWSTIVHGMSWGTPLVTGRHVFAGTVNQNLPGTLIRHRAGLVKLDRATGRVLWRIALPDAPEGKFAGYAGGPVLAGGKVVVAGLDGLLRAYPEE